MKKIFVYIPLLVFLLACNSEDEFAGQGKPESEGMIEVPFMLSISSETDKGMRTTRADAGQDNSGIPAPPIAGEADVDKVRLCIFQSTQGENSSLSDYKYIGEQTFQPTFSDSEHVYDPNQETDKVCEGSISLESGENIYYRVLAIAYDSKDESALTFYDTDDGKQQLFQSGSTLENARIALTNFSTDGGSEYHTPELFVAYLYDAEDLQQSSVYPLDNITEDTRFLGQLYRAVGYVSVTLTDVPEEVKSMTLVSEVCPSESDIYDNDYIVNFSNSDQYPMGFVNENLEKTYTTVCTQEMSNGASNTSVTLSSFFFPFNAMFKADGTSDETQNRTKFYMDVDEEGKGKKRYMIRCADTEIIPTIWLGYYEQIVKDFTFIVKINWKTVISGSFDDLKEGNGMKIDLSPFPDTEIGTLGK